PQRVRAVDEQVHHMVGLVEQDGRLAPGTLLAPPVGELSRHDRVDVRADLRASQELDDAAAAIEDFLEVACAHGYLPSARLDPGRCLPFCPQLKTRTRPARRTCATASGWNPSPITSASGPTSPGPARPALRRTLDEHGLVRPDVVVAREQVAG